MSQRCRDELNSKTEVVQFILYAPVQRRLKGISMNLTVRKEISLRS